MSIVTRVRQVHRIAVVAVARRLGGRRSASWKGARSGPHPLLRHHDPARRRVFVRWQAWIGGLFS
jgi:hypothetical protein